MITTVIFDMDGTLLDSETLSRIATDYGFQEVFGRKLTDEEHSKLIGRPVQLLMKEFYDQRGEIAYIKGREFFEKHLKSISPFEGVIDLLNYLRERRITMAVVTSSHRDTAYLLLTMTGLIDYFNAVVGQEDTVYHKPEPDPINRCIEKIGASRENTIYVGDQPYDIIAARAAGIRSVGATWGSGIEEILRKHNPDFICRNMDEFISVLRKA